MGKLTKRSVEALAPRDIDYIAWDNDVPGFGVRVMPSGRKSFVLQYRAGRRSRRMALGYVNVVTPEQARAMATQHLAALRQGVDPLTERDGSRDAVTVKDLAARFDAEHIAVHLKPSTQKEYRRTLKKFILPFFGNRPMAEVSREEVARFPQVPARPLPSQPLLGDPLQDVQSRRAVGLASGRLEPAQAH
jgi:Arm DNA-binding domain/Phage integrase, N-terminal SAM-like domain